MNNVSVEKKQKFIKWALDNLNVKRARSFSLLFTFGKYSRFNERIRFVENAKKYPYGIEISAQCSSRKAFVFYKPNVTVTEMDAAYEHFDENENESNIYIQLNFKGKYSNPLYMEVLEDDDPPLETDLSHVDHEGIEKAISELEGLSKSQLIDYALDIRDKNLFDKLVAN